MLVRAAAARLAGLEVRHAGQLGARQGLGLEQRLGEVARDAGGVPGRLDGDAHGHDLARPRVGLHDGVVLAARSPVAARPARCAGLLKQCRPAHEPRENLIWSMQASIQFSTDRCFNDLSCAVNVARHRLKPSLVLVYAAKNQGHCDYTITCDR